MLYQGIKNMYGRTQLLVFYWFALLFCASFSQGYGQEVKPTSSDITFWIYGGPSVTTLGIGSQAGLAIDYSNHLFSIGTTSTDFDFRNETWDIALTYGRSMNYRSFYLSAGTGVAVVGGNGYSNLFGKGTKTPFETTIGFPLRGQISWQPIQFLGVGIKSFFNVNTEQPFGGVGVSLRVGRLQKL